MPWQDYTSDDVAAGNPASATRFAQKTRGNVEYLRTQIGGTSGGGSGSGPANGGFEVLNDVTQLPEGWTRTLYSGGSGGIYTTDPAHGATAVYLTHPGGAGNGGGHWESDYTETDGLCRKFLSFIHWATAAGMRNKVIVRYFDKAKVSLSADETIYNSTANPNVKTLFVAQFNPPAGTCFYKVRLIGGDTATATGGTAYFDGVRESGVAELFGSKTTDFAIAEAQRVSSSWGDSGSTTFIPPLLGLPCILTFSADVMNAGLADETASQRFRVGTYYSNEATGNVMDAYVTNTFELAFSAAVSVTIYQQLKHEGGRTAKGRKLTGETKILFDSQA